LQPVIAMLTLCGAALLVCSMLPWQHDMRLRKRPEHAEELAHWKALAIGDLQAVHGQTKPEWSGATAGGNAAL
jgi:hypothetical protein